jgi:signal transduction histidine kinase/ActR/RegA family two-component response regulator
VTNTSLTIPAAQRFAARIRAARVRLAHALLAWGGRDHEPRARVLIATSNAISAAPDIGQLMATVLGQLDLVVPSASSAIHLLEGDRQRLVAFRSFPSAAPPVGSAWPCSDVPLTAEIAKTKRPLVVPDVRAEPRWVTLPSMQYIRSWMGLPLLAQGEVLGFLMLDRQATNAFGAAEVELAGAFASQLALALRLARLATDNERRLAELSALYALSRTASASLALDRLLPELALRLRAVVGAASCVLALVDEDGNMDLAADSPLESGALAWGADMAALPCVREVVAAGGPLRLGPVDGEAGAAVALRALAGAEVVLGVPLLAQGEAIGAALFGYAQAACYQGEDALRQVELAAGQAALAYANARLLAAAQRHARELALRDEIRMAIAAAPPTLEALAHSVTSSLVRACGYAIADCWEVRESKLVLVSSCDVSMGWVYLPITSGVCGAVARSGQARLIPDVRSEPDYLPPLDVPLNDSGHFPLPERAERPIVSELCVPVFDGGRVAMVLNVEHSQRLRQSDLRLLSDIAAQVGLALEHVRLLGEIRRVQSERAQTARVSAIGTLAAGVAHEFNNMLAALIGYAQLGLSGTPEERIEALEVVEQVARRGKQITGGLLSFAEPGAAYPSPAQLGDLCDQALRSIEHELIVGGVTIQRRYAPDDTVHVDQPKVVQALSHLLANARDAMLGGGALTLRSAREGSWAVLTIADTGPGILPAVRDHLFEPFVTTKGVLGGGSQGGVGLGLATAYGIVRRHGGLIDVSSSPGKGSTFSVRLPYVAAQASLGQEERAMRVLLAEDDDVVQALLRTALVRAGYVVSLSSSAAAALARLREGGIDVLICDLGLPDRESIELLHQLLATRLTLPVVLIATPSSAAALPAWNDTPVAGVIQQPFHPEAVLSVLDAVREERMRAISDASYE